MLEQKKNQGFVTREKTCKIVTSRCTRLVLQVLLSYFIAPALFAASLEGILDREGRAWSEKTETGVVAEDTGSWATISGGGEAFYYFYVPYTAQENLTQLYLYWYGQRTDVLGQGAAVSVYDSNSGQWNHVAIDNSPTEDWRGPFYIPPDYLSVVNGSSRVLKVRFQTGLLDSYRLKTVRLDFSYTDWELEQGDLEAAYACSLATIQTDRFHKMVNEYDLWADSNNVDGDLFWMWAASVYQFANHLQAVDIQSLTDLLNLPSGIQGLYEDIFELGLFELIDCEHLKNRYMGLHPGADGGPIPSSMAPDNSMASYLSSVNSNLRKAARRLGGFTSDAGSTREECFEELYQVFDSCSIDYFGIPSSRDGSLTYHGEKWEFYWNFAADGVVVEDVNKMGRKAAKAGAVMKEFGDAWLNSFATVEVSTDPPGLNVHINGTYYATSPVSWHSIKGASHFIVAYPQILHEGKMYYFIGWNDGGEQIHTVSPTSNTTYIAYYEDADLSDDGIVNFKDYAMLAEHWMETKLVFEDNFEEYSQGEFPEGWEEIYGGTETPEVVSTPFDPNNMSFKICGTRDWHAHIVHPIGDTGMSPSLSIEFDIAQDATDCHGVLVQLWSSPQSHFRLVCLSHASGNPSQKEIYLISGPSIGPWEPETWYHFRIDILSTGDTEAPDLSCHYWMNGTDLGIYTYSAGCGYDKLDLTGGAEYGGAGKGWFDNIVVTRSNLPDLNQDGFVKLEDLEILVSHWLEGVE